MGISKHAKKRGQQRGIPKDLTELVINEGTPIQKPGNAMEYKVLKSDRSRIMKNLKKWIQVVERTENISVLLSSNGTIITQYHSK